VRPVGQLLTSDFLPHGTCYLWNPRIVWLHVISDALITLSYYCIPLILIYLVRRRRDLPFNWIFWMFGIFILGCGTTHLMEIWTVWHPDYFLSGLIKAGTALVSVATALALIPTIPKVLAIVSPQQLQAANRELQRETSIRAERERQLMRSAQQLEQRIKERTGELEAINKSLENEVAVSIQTQAALRASEECIRLIIEAALDAVITIDSAGTITGWNPQAEMVFGWSRETVLGRSLAETIVPDRFREAHTRGLQRFLSGGEATVLNRRVEISAVHADGHEFPVEVSITPIRTGQTISFSAFVRDITERRQAEEALRTSQARLNGIIQSATDAILTVDSEQRLILFNKAAEKMFGCSATEALGQSIERFIPVRFRAQHAGHIRRFGKTGVSDRAMGKQNPLCGLRASGEEFPVEASISQVESDGKKVFTAIIRDISERKRIEEELRANEEQFRVLLDGVKDFAIYMLDPNGRVLSWNAGATRIKGFSSEEIIGQHFGRFYTAEDQAKGRPELELQQAADKGRFEDQGLRVRKDGTTFWANAVITPMYDEAGALRGFSKVLRDITERRRAEEEIRQLNRELEQRVRERTQELEVTNKELEAFTYSVSHDLRAPLRHIAGFSKMLGEQCGELLKPEGQHYLQRIEDGTRRMGTLVDDLLNLARIGRHELRVQVTGLDSIVKDVISELRPDTEGRDVQWKIVSLPFVEGDPALLKVVFHNLLSNALKYTRPRSHAVIEIGRDEIDGQPTVFVRDNGVGFNMKYADKLFGVFQRLHRAEDFEGTGVGLATVQRVIQKHGGRIWAQAELDKGATFYFSLGNTKHVRFETNSAGGTQ
jgi:PAS domain S-box-containing protein